MKMIKTALAVCLLGSVAYGQSVQDAQKAIESEYYYKAKRMLLHVNQTAPTVESNYYLGNVYLLLDKADSAKFYYKQASAFDEGKNPLIYVSLGKLELLKNNKTGAQENFDQAIKVSKSKSPEIFYQIGAAYAGIDDALAIKNFDIAYSMDPELVINLLAYGDLFLAEKKPGDAMTKYQQAQNANPNIAVTYLRIGRVNALVGKNKEAISAFEKCVELDPNIAVGWKELGEQYYLDGQYDKVKYCFDKYLELNAEDKESRIVVAVTQYQIGDFKGAIEESRKVLADDPKNFVAYRIIFYSCYALGDSLMATDTAMANQYFMDGLDAVNKFWNISEKTVKPLDYENSAHLRCTKDTEAILYYTMFTENDSSNVGIFSEFENTVQFKDV
ncbi:MAG: hypothetical protein R2794_03230 [Chitinophagales bacterium]